MRLSPIAVSLFLLSTAPLVYAQAPGAKPAGATPAPAPPPAAAKPAPQAPAPAPTAAPTPAPTPSTMPDVAHRNKNAGLLDLNTATVDELKTLPGITDEIAGKIVAGRPYKGKDALLKQNLVDKDTYAKIRPLVVAKQPKAEKPAQPAAPAAK